MNQDLINRYLRGETSAKENLKVLSWVEEDPENEKLLQAMHRVYDAALLSEDVEVADVKRKRRSFRLGMRHIAYSFAAGAAIVLAVLATAEAISDNLAQRMNRMAVTQVYSTRSGEQMNVTLPDGSNVWLNSCSSLELLAPSGKSFGSAGKRMVKLTGEAFFDVARDESRPFNVATEALDVTVLGTVFDVKSYDSKTYVVLESGSVKVSDRKEEDAIVISPGQMYVLDSNTGKKELHNVQSSNYVTWKDGYLTFDATPLNLIFEQMQNYYSVSFLFDGKCNQSLLSGKLDLKCGMERSMENLKMLVPFTWFKTENGDIIVQIK